jgi:MFS family permease
MVGEMAPRAADQLETGARISGDSYAAKNAPYWKRNLAVCVFGSFTTLMSLTLLLPFLPIYVQQLGVSSQAAIVEWTGLAFGATFLGTGLTAPLWGHAGDRYGRKTMLIRAAVGMTIVIPLIGIVHNVYQLTGLRLAAGLIGGYASSSTQLVASQAPREKAGWALGILSTGSLAGNLLGPLIGGMLPGYIGIRNTFFAAGGLIAVAMFATIFLIREDSSPTKNRDTCAADAAMEVPESSTTRVALATMLGTVMLVLFANMSIEPIITIYLQGLPGDHARDIFHAGLVMSAAAFGSILVAARMGRLADRIGAWKLIQYCLLATSVVLIPQALISRWWELLLLRFVMGMTLVGLLPAVAKLIRSSVPERSLGKILGYSQSSQYAGQVLGPLIGGFIGGRLGMRWVFVVTSAILLVAAHFNRRAERLTLQTQ